MNSPITRVYNKSGGGGGTKSSTATSSTSGTTQPAAAAAPRRRVIRPQDIGLPSSSRDASREGTPIQQRSIRSSSSAADIISYDNLLLDNDDAADLISQSSYLELPRHSYSLPANLATADSDVDSDDEDDAEYTDRCDTGRESGKEHLPTTEGVGKEGDGSVTLPVTVNTGASTARDSAPEEKSGSAHTTNSSVGVREEKEQIGQSKAEESKGNENNSTEEEAAKNKALSSWTNSDLPKGSEHIAVPEDDQIIEPGFVKVTKKTMPLALMTFVGRESGVRNIKKSLVETFNKATEMLPKEGEMYSICEKFDTYIKGGLYPLLHISKDATVIKSLQESHHFLEVRSLGEDLFVDQAVYKEVANIISPDAPESNESVITVAAFRSVDQHPNEKLIENWKSWTGARAFMIDMIGAGLQCKQISFYVRSLPLLEEEDHNGFYYVLVCEVAIREPSDEGLIVDLLQRFRVERWFGYQTIYRHYRRRH